MKSAYYFFGEYLEKGEKIRAVIHRNIAVMTPVFFKTFLIGFVFPVAVLYFFPTLFWAGLAWMVMAVMRIFYDLYDWYYYVWLITDRAVVDIRSPSLFEVSTTRIEYHMVEGVSYTISGFWRTVLQYGDVTLEKVGGNSKMMMDGANNPKKIERLILKYQEEYMENHNFSSHDTLKSLLSGMLYEHMKKSGHIGVQEAEVVEALPGQKKATKRVVKKRVIKKVTRP